MENEIEKLEDDKMLEVLPENTGVIARNKSDVEDILFLAENIDKIVQAQNKIRMALLKLAQPGDWVTFGKDDKKKAEIGFAGAMRIGATIGVSFIDWVAEKETGTDEKGEWYRWNYECTAIYRNRTVRVFGRASSRDKFFGKEYGEYKQLHDIDEGNIKMAARRGAMKEGVKVMFGLHHMDPKEIEKYGVKLEHAGKVEFKSKETQQNEATQEILSVVVQIGGITKKVDPKGKWTRYTLIDTDDVKYTTFDKAFAELADKAKVAKQTVNIEYVTTQYGNDIKNVTFCEVPK